MKLSKLNLFFLLICLLVVFSPMLYMSFFNHPSTDDYGFMVKVKEMGYFKACYSIYTGWLNRFTAIIIIAAYPVFFQSDFGYIFLPMVFMALILVGTKKLTNQLFTSLYFPNSSIIFSVAFIVLYFFKMPNIAEGIFWFNGAVPYQLGNIFSLFLFASLLARRNKESIIDRWGWPVLFLFLIVGSNETIMLFWLFFIGYINVNHLIHHKQIHKGWAMFLVLGCLFSLLVFLSPGNAVRSSFFVNNHQLIPSIKMSIVECFRYFNQWIVFSPLVPITLLLIPLFCAFIKNGTFAISIFKVKPWLSLLGFIFILVFLFFPAYWSMGNRPPERTVNAIYFIFILGWFYHIILFLHFYYSKEIVNLAIFVNPVVKAVLFLLILFQFNLPNNIKGAWMDVKSGIGPRYDDEINQRYQLIKKCQTDTCDLPEIKNRPFTLFQHDLFPETENAEQRGANISMGQYYNRKYLKLKDK